MGDIPARVMAVIATVAEARGCTVDDILGQSRRRQYAWPRQEAMAAVRAMTWFGTGYRPSFPMIAKWFSRDHATVYYGIAEFERRRQLYDGPLTPSAN